MQVAACQPRSMWGAGKKLEPDRRLKVKRGMLVGARIDWTNKSAFSWQTQTQVFANMNAGFYAAMDFHHCYRCHYGFWVFVYLHLKVPQNDHNWPLHLVGCTSLLEVPLYHFSSPRKLFKRPYHWHVIRVTHLELQLGEKEKIKLTNKYCKQIVTDRLILIYISIYIELLVVYSSWMPFRPLDFVVRAFCTDAVWDGPSKHWTSKHVRRVSI